jgi:hypothetical protein
MEAFHTLPTVLFLSVPVAYVNQPNEVVTTEGYHYQQIGWRTGGKYRGVHWSKSNRLRVMCWGSVHGTSFFSLSVGSDIDLHYRQ